MAEWSDSQTSITLLETLRRAPKDAAAWERFVWRYRPMICGWCREWGLQGADAEDVAQNVLAKLTEKLEQFQYDPSRCFRAWLKTITQRAWSDEISDRYRGSDSRIIQRLESLEARADLKRRFEETFDRELMEIAIHRVQGKVSRPTWEAFRLTALEGLSGAEASGRLAASVASVFVSKHRVQKLLKEEIRKLEAAHGD
ncbi:RNA polymerase sigma factor [Tundrisphaera lichenicola]|uniref:RNA polymerase sigma factor n=1 Tax=Tundrisphaera lichenicola TaxID=2029860 RepID=UPI003EBF70C1